MNEQLKLFIQKIEADVAWRESVEGLPKPELVAASLAKAAELGIALTAADFEQPEGELSEDELSAVSGGSSCYCVAGGGGTDSMDGYASCKSYGSNEYTCACVAYGEGRANTYRPSGDCYVETERCVCWMYGDGDAGVNC